MLCSVCVIDVKVSVLADLRALNANAGVALVAGIAFFAGFTLVALGTLFSSVALFSVNSVEGFEPLRDAALKSVFNSYFISRFSAQKIARNKRNADNANKYDRNYFFHKSLLPYIQ